MKGMVQFFNNVKGLGFIMGEDGGRYFVHHSSIQMPGFRTLLPGWQVEFDPLQKPDGKLEAKNVRPLAAEGLTSTAVVVRLVVGTVPNVCIGETAGEEEIKLVDWSGQHRFEPALSAGNFAACLVAQKVEGFSLNLPVSTGEEVWLVLDPEGKEPQAIPSDGRYDRVPLATYLMRVTAEGVVMVWCLGARGRGTGGAWVIIERRFEHRYNFGPEAAPIAEQTQTSGLARDNDGFVPAVEFGRMALGELAKEER